MLLPLLRLPLAYACCALLWPIMAFAVRPVAPPSVQFTSPDNNIVDATVLDKPTLTSFDIEIHDVLHGAGEGRLTLRATAEQVSPLVIGRRYLVAYTNLTFEPQSAKIKFIDPAGPKLVQLLEGPAGLLPPEASVRSLIALARSQGDVTPR
ncbi:MAG: hypothetical protein AAFX85_17865, partial [Pseudomonadota bacterium]